MTLPLQNLMMELFLITHPHNACLVLSWACFCLFAGVNLIWVIFRMVSYHLLSWLGFWWHLQYLPPSPRGKSQYTTSLISLCRYNSYLRMFSLGSLFTGAWEKYDLTIESIFIWFEKVKDFPSRYQLVWLLILFTISKWFDRYHR